MSDSGDLQATFAREDAARMLDAQRRMQDGVASYPQLTAGGLSRIDIERAVRRNELRRVHPRVYVNHSGPLTWEQRAWAAVLYARLKVEDNALAMANEARSEIDAIARVAEVASRSYVTAATLQASLDRAHSLRRRKLIQGLVDDLATGTHSVLEHDGALGHGSWRDQARDADRTLDDLAELGTMKSCGQTCPLNE